MKKIFYNKRHKVPASSQVYLAWLFLFAIAALWIYNLEVERNSQSPRKSYDYKKEYEVVSALHLKTLTWYPESHKFNRSLIYNVNESIKKSKWNIEEVIVKHEKQDCKFIHYFRDLDPKVPKEAGRLVILFDHSGIEKSFYLMQTLVQGILRENIKYVSVVSMQGNSLCSEYYIKNYQTKNAQAGFIYIYPTRLKSQILLTGNSQGKFSSIAWSSIIPESIDRPGILQQLANQAVPLFKKTISYEQLPIFNSIGWGVPQEIFLNEVNSIHNILPPLMFVLKNYPPTDGKFAKNSFWLELDSALSTRAVTILGIFLALIIWLPITNRLYENETVNYLFRSIFSTLFSSIEFFVIAAVIKLGSLIAPTSNYLALLIPFLFLILHWIFSKFKKNIFDINVNALTEYLIMCFFISVLTFYNTSLVIFILPLIFVAAKKGKIDSSAFLLLLWLSITPLIYAMYLNLSILDSSDIGNMLTLGWFNENIFDNIGSTSMIFLCAGSLITISKRSK